MSSILKNTSSFPQVRPSLPWTSTVGCYFGFCESIAITYIFHITPVLSRQICGYSSERARRLTLIHLILTTTFLDIPFFRSCGSERLHDQGHRANEFIAKIWIWVLSGLLSNTSSFYQNWYSKFSGKVSQSFLQPQLLA